MGPTTIDKEDVNGRANGPRVRRRREETREFGFIFSFLSSLLRFSSCSPFLRSSRNTRVRNSIPRPSALLSPNRTLNPGTDILGLSSVSFSLFLSLSLSRANTVCNSRNLRPTFGSEFGTREYFNKHIYTVYMRVSIYTRVQP